MTRSMLVPGKQHNFRVSKNASWTDAFNRIASRNQWSVNHTINVLIHSALNMNELTNESVMVEISPKEFELLRQLRQNPLQSILITEDDAATPKVTASPAPVVTQPEPEPKAQKEAPVASSKPSSEASDRPLTAFEKAKRQAQSSSM